MILHASSPEDKTILVMYMSKLIIKNFSLHYINKSAHHLHCTESIYSQLATIVMLT